MSPPYNDGDADAVRHNLAPHGALGAAARKEYHCRPNGHLLAAVQSGESDTFVDSTKQMLSGVIEIQARETGPRCGLNERTALSSRKKIRVEDYPSDPAGTDSTNLPECS